MGPLTSAFSHLLSVILVCAAPSIDRTFAALADPTRRGVVELLRKKPRRAGELAVALDMSPPAMSRHLRVLRKTGLVDEEAEEDDARVRVYRLCPEPFASLRVWLDEVEGYWADQLAAFKAHAEASRSRGAGSGGDRPSKRSKR
jgi:DNA-binding transcriptional ArsR family regulator